MNYGKYPRHEIDQPEQPAGNPVTKRKSPIARSLAGLAVLLLLWLAGVMIYQTHKPLPRGLSYESPEYTVQNVSFLYDLTYPGENAGIVQERNIVDRMYEMVGEARRYIVLDMFLFNDYIHKDAVFPDVSGELVRSLIEQKKKYPSLEAVVITDEINTNYGSAPNELFEQLKSAGVRIVVADMNPLRDSTPAYSAVWRTFIQWFGESGHGWIPNLMASDGPDITARSYLKLLNVKANHRKVLVTENGSLISSGNVHNASAYHSNIAFEVDNSEFNQPILKSEQAVLNFSGGGSLPGLEAVSGDGKSQENLEPGSSAAADAAAADAAEPEAKVLSDQTGGLPTQTASGPEGTPDATAKSDPVRIRYLTEGKIDSRLLSLINQLDEGDTLWMGMFYLGDKKVVKALLKASERGTAIRLVLDPNENAFGRDKIGIPNRPVAERLVTRSAGKIQIRWYNTTNEQYHTKLVYAVKASGDSEILGGSANLTPRNLRNYNLENMLWIKGSRGSGVFRSVEQYFNRLWNNEGASYTLDYSAYRQQSVWFKEIVFDLQNALGFTTF